MYLPLIVADGSRPDYLATVDVDPASPTYSQAQPTATSLIAMTACAVLIRVLYVSPPPHLAVWTCKDGVLGAGHTPATNAPQG